MHAQINTKARPQWHGMRRREAWPKPKLPPFLHKPATNTCRRAKLAHGLNRKRIGIFDSKKTAHHTHKSDIHSQRYEI